MSDVTKDLVDGIVLIHLSANMRALTPVYSILMYIIVEGSLETKVQTIWTDEKQRSQEEAEPGRNSDV